jgi:hypothetical protein
LASPFSNDPPSRGFGAPDPPSRDSGEPGPTSNDNRPEGTTPGTEQPVSAAQQKFLSCRWRKAAENGLPDHCGHRDVLPMAGATGFVSDSWCPDCAYFKAKRTPRKREEIERDRDRDWRW